VGRWLWKTGSSCNDINNVGRKTQTFKQDEYAKVVHNDHQSWVKEACTSPAETFISCLDFQMAGGPTPGPTPPTPPPPPPPPPKPTKAVCCYSNWGDDNSCGQYTGPGSQCNTDHTKKCSSDSDCPRPSLQIPLQSPPSPPCPFKHAMATPNVASVSGAMRVLVAATWGPEGNAITCRQRLATVTATAPAIHRHHQHHQVRLHHHQHLLRRHHRRLRCPHLQAQEVQHL
jgi:hypothetical protein